MMEQYDVHLSSELNVIRNLPYRMAANTMPMNSNTRGGAAIGSFENSWTIPRRNMIQVPSRDSGKGDFQILVYLESVIYAT